MRKILTALLCALCIISLTACSGAKVEEGGTEVQGGGFEAPSTNESAPEQKEDNLAALFATAGSGGNRYFGNEVTFGSDKGFDKKYWYTPLGLSVREVNISGVGLEKEVLIGVVSDPHLRNDSKALAAFETSIKVASLTDSVVLCGDIVEGFKYESSAELFKDYFGGEYKNALCVVGNHDKYSDDFAENEQYLSSVWPHNHNYYSKTVGEKVVLVGVNNGADTFSAEQCTAFESEIKSARSGGKVILFFCHVPPTTLNTTNTQNAKMIELLTKNTDVVKVVISGHAHGDSKKMLETLPQYTIEGTGHDYMRSNVLIVSVK